MTIDNIPLGSIVDRVLTKHEVREPLFRISDSGVVIPITQSLAEGVCVVLTNTIQLAQANSQSEPRLISALSLNAVSFLHDLIHDGHPGCLCRECLPMLTTFINQFCQYFTCNPISRFSDSLVRCLLSEELNDEDRQEKLTAELDGDYSYSTDTQSGRPRRLLPVEQESPIIQVNMFRTGAEEHRESWLQLKRLSEQIKRLVEDEGFQCDVSARYAPIDQPNQRYEQGTWAALLRSSATITLSPHGRVGMGKSLQIASGAMMPKLVLQSDDNETSERFGSKELSGEIHHTYLTERQACEHVRQFLEDHRESIMARSRWLARIEHEHHPPIYEKVLALGPDAFISPFATFDMARFWSEPLHYQQASHVIREWLTTITNAPSRKVSKMDDQGLRVESFRNLLAYGRREYGDNFYLPVIELLDVWEEDPAIFGLSYRSSPVPVEAWANLDNLRRL